MTIAKEKFKYLFVAGGRRSGRTTAMIAGAKNTPGCTVICATERHAGNLRGQNPGIKFISLDNLDQLVGTHKPLLVDHYALEELWYLREREIDLYIKKVLRESK